MNSILRIPEIEALESRPNLIRIPDQLDVPLTRRAMKLVDSEPFQKLSSIDQLGLVALVYPGATHSRFEHSLGVYRNALLFIRQLSQSKQFVTFVNQNQVSALIAAALLHDIGHWPYCHPIEDLGLADVPKHEDLAEQHILDTEIATTLRTDWNLDPQDVVALIKNQRRNPVEKILGSILSGPIDIDKMDYLYRDSLHAGVPYGKNFDSLRLINSLCLNESNDGIAITTKGKTAAEMMVFARYVMFSEVYWHHAVRSATAMFQRVFFRWQQKDRSMAAECIASPDPHELLKRIRRESDDNGTKIFSCLFGKRRRLYKRLANFTLIEHPQLYKQIAQQPYPWLVECGTQLASRISNQIRTLVNTDDVLIDAPPVGLEVQFRVSVWDQKLIPIDRWQMFRPWCGHWRLNSSMILSNRYAFLFIPALP